MKKLLLPLFSIIFINFISCKDIDPKVDNEYNLEIPEVIVQNELPPDSATINRAWEKHMTPSKTHEIMAQDNGVWEEEITMWASRKSDPVKSTFKVINKMILGGRYQESTHKGDMMGMPFEGISTLAYDNTAQEYVSTWIDNMGTGIMVMKGQFNSDTKSINFEGKTIDPLTRKEKKLKEIFTYIDSNTQKIEMFDIDYDGKQFKSMEAILKRK
ncbi:DUF1579 domain-containing protein [Flavobacterium jejuense]|uniref:DUF1579 domain-containing protein n=1 Tax=Flavobacterium jejuense TaxID=1544455 RepID=A0ABX0IR35_9FLAO|nr:DUF1579 domain-containing protein [Flavobacterium jejuense]NHN24300.1 DUF1579 domain-containing protein [Flavobacterium jejuense]